MNKIIFKNITIQNFKSIGPEIYFDFEKHNGLNYIYGTNLDIDGTANGVGKCVDENTEIEISFEDEEIKATYENFIKKNEKVC